MSWKLFRRGAGNKPRVRGEARYAPGTKLSYDPELIPRFKGHHVTLIKLFGELRESAQTDDYGRIPERLNTFRRVLETHLLEENLRLYTYLTKCLYNDTQNAELVQNMKREMEGIGRQVNQFIRHYADFGVDARNIRKFKADLKAIGTALTDRIEREEKSLYSLYLPPGDYD